MTFRQLAASSIRGNRHRYMAFFLSSVFSVMIFFLFAQFIYHPGVVNGTIRAAAKVRGGLQACEYIIVIFSVLFILYSNSAFLKSRKKEFGLLSLFGMTPGQIRRLVLYENTFIALLSIAVGIGCGALFSKMFFMAMTALLKVENPIPFELVPKAVWLTALCFFLAFQGVTLLSFIRLGRTPIIELLKASKKPKSLPVSNRWLTALAAVCLAAGYALAVSMRLATFQVLVLPILFLTVIGTYFLFTQASVGVLRRLQRTYPVFYRETNMVTISQLVFKLKDNARLLFMVSILSAVILTASGTFYILFQDAKSETMERFPQTVGFVENGLDAHEVLDPSRLLDILKEDGQTVAYEGKLAGVVLNNTLQKSVLVPESGFNRFAEKTDVQKPADVEPGQILLVRPKFYGTMMEKGETLETSVGGKTVSFQVMDERGGAVVNPAGDFEVLVVADDREYEQLTSGLKPEEYRVYYGYELEHWTTASDTMNKLYAEVPEANRKRFEERVNPYLEYKQFNSLTLFIGLFVSFLFFIAAGSMIYFKLFTELQEDQALYRSLSRIGVSNRELMRIGTTQIGLIFFLPVAVGLVHASFAFKALRNLMSADVVLYGSTVAGIFALLQLVYFLVTRRAYMRTVVGK